MEKALESCRHAIVVLSREFLTRPQPCAELRYAYKRMKWLNEQGLEQWRSLWVVLYDLSVHDYTAIRNDEHPRLPPLVDEIVLMEYANGKGEFRTWPILCDELKAHIMEHDRELAIERWSCFLESWHHWGESGFPRAKGLYETEDGGPHE